MSAAETRAVIDRLAETRKDIGASELPPLEIPRRAPLQIFSVGVETRLDFT